MCVCPDDCAKYLLNVSLDEPYIKGRPANIRRLNSMISETIRNRNQLDEFNFCDYGNSKDLNIVFHSKYFQPYNEIFDDTFKFVGCSIRPQEETTEFQFDLIEKDKPVLYISFGTTVANENIDFYQKCFQAFGKMDIQVVLALGNTICISDLGVVPENFIIRNSVPQLKILQIADLYITHGGMNGVCEALYYNVPLIVIPQHGDQYAVGNRVRQLNAGICIEDNNITADILREAVQNILMDDKFVTNVNIVGTSLRESGGYVKAADEIFILKKQKGIK